MTTEIGAYDCGELIAVASDSALDNYDLFDLWAAMVASSDHPERYEVDDYFAVLQKLGASTEIIERLRMLSTESIDNADRVLRDLLNAAGVEAHETDGHISRIALVE
jgi:hypothetical protein